MKKLKTGTYKEDDWIAKVKILKDESDEKWSRFTLKVIKTIHKSNIYKPTKNGTIFSVDKMKNFSCSGMWVLEIDNE